MDEALASAALDLGGRPYLVFDGAFRRERVGDLPTELVPHFFRSLCDAAGMTLHLSVHGENDHHQVEGCFKAVARALGTAIRRDGAALPRTKGLLLADLASGWPAPPRAGPTQGPFAPRFVPGAYTPR